ncbi:MAG: sulfotransferase [Candidatus Omnitrophica bacterium]|nr:sulfotransferase [Candidatus Omnitrophota bacterium]
MRKGPIFITGIYRSGSTLLSRILNAHPMLAVTYDSIQFMRFSYGRFDPLDKRNAANLVEEVYTRISKRFGLTFDKEAVMKRVSGAGEVSYAQVYDAIMDQFLLRNKPGAVAWGEKTNVAWGKIPFFLRMFPLGKAIIIVRDPRDVLCSFKKLTNAPWPDYLDSVFASLDALQKGSEFKKTLPADRFFLIRYEDLVSDTEDSLRKLAGFLEVPYDAAMLDTSHFQDRKGDRWKFDTMFSDPLKGISEKASYRWKRVILNEELFLAELILGEWLTEYGYEPSGKTFSMAAMKKAFSMIRQSCLLKGRFVRWLETGCGVEAYPTDPLNPANWGEQKHNHPGAIATRSV